MSVTTATRPAAPVRSAPSLWRVGLVAVVLAAAATELYTAVIRAAGVHLAIGNIGATAKDVVEIGPGACTIMVVMCVAAGLVIATALNRWAKRPAHTFSVTAYVLTALSFVPDLFAGASATSSKLTLMGAHVIAATIVIPLVTRTLKPER
ncbi:MAG TPA: DUF6069 family protein [Jatrophihabitans sp.]|jgi:hypothetical protein|nr:DUF6069 family protein [Jatrophihabitans sp.]